MKSEWKMYRLGDLGKIVTGKTPPTRNSSYWNGDIPFVTPKDIQVNKYCCQTERSLTTAGIEIIKNCKLPKGSLCVSCIGSIGYVAMLANDSVTNQQINSIIVSKDFDKDFIFYLLRSLKSFFIHYTGSGSVLPILNKATFQQIKVKVPSLPTQRKIAAILSSLDDKIENNNAICNNLEEQAAALYKSWFVDFEPFGGQLPKSWRERDIYSIAEVIYGAPFSSKLFNSEKRGVPILRIRDLKKQDSDVYTDEVHPKAYVISPGDIVVGMDGEFQPHIWGGVEGLLNQRVCVFRNMRPKGSFFLYFTILPQLNFIEKTEMATTVIHIGKKDFDAFRVLVPTDDVLEKFDALSDPMYKEIVSLRQENRRLFSLRDTLLPKLMSGEVEVDKVAI